MYASVLVAFAGVFFACGLGFAFVAYAGKQLKSVRDEQQAAQVSSDETAPEPVAGKH